MVVDKIADLEAAKQARTSTKDSLQEELKGLWKKRII